ncbi:mandelate racemase/muconate lactonizing enzyme family protein [Geminicoccaceae bacterium 1502E]|nr:mandelate racemase/muconate lactonizing enzyme family protein [Geminicoccaceae bacterium 1502E]
MKNLPTSLEAIAPRRIDVHLLRAPLDRPVMNAIGNMHDRPCLLVRIEDRDGAEGWGEIWCNYPTCGAEHRARLLETAIAPALLELTPQRPPETFARLSQRFRRLAIQGGEPGPVAQVLAGLDLALWDLAARRAEVPLWRLLGGAAASLPAYASGINPDVAPELIAASREAGFRAFKMKVGFDPARDRRHAVAARLALRRGERLMMDANQAWPSETAPAMIDQLKEIEPYWLEEPIAADTPWGMWRSLADAGIPLAAGENLRGEAEFAAAVAGGALRFVQPDACKWGGISGTLPVARSILQAGLVYCPHYLGGAPGLLASAHLLAAAGGAGLLEVDVNANPLRSALCGPLPPVIDGVMTLGDEPGLGIEPDPEQLERYTTLHRVMEAD